MPETAWMPTAFPQYSAPTPPHTGVIPLRPLSIGDIFTGTMAAIRANWPFHAAATAAVMSIVAVISGLHISFISHALRRIAVDTFFYDYDFSVIEEAWRISSQYLVSSSSIAALAGIATFLLTGFLSIGVADSVIGRRTTVSQAWARFRSRILPLLGTSVLIFIFTAALLALAVLLTGATLLGGIAAAIEASDSQALIIVGMIFAFLFIAGLFGFFAFAITVRFVFAPYVCTLEELGPFESIARSWALTKGAFWRVFGRYLLLNIIISAVISALVSALSALVPAVIFFIDSSVFDGILAALSALLAAVAVPVQVAFATLMYTDERIRRENFATTLYQATGTATTWQQQNPSQ